MHLLPSFTSSALQEVQLLAEMAQVAQEVLHTRQSLPSGNLPSGQGFTQLDSSRKSPLLHVRQELASPAQVAQVALQF